MPPPVDLVPKITELRDDTRLDAFNRPVKEKVMTFFLGNYGPFTHRFSVEEYNADAARNVIVTEQANLRRLFEVK